MSNEVEKYNKEYAFLQNANKTFNDNLKENEEIVERGEPYIIKRPNLIKGVLFLVAGTALIALGLWGLLFKKEVTKLKNIVTAFVIGAVCLQRSFYIFKSKNSLGCFCITNQRIFIYSETGKLTEMSFEEFKCKRNSMKRQ